MAKPEIPNDERMTKSMVVFPSNLGWFAVDWHAAQLHCARIRLRQRSGSGRRLARKPGISERRTRSDAGGRSLLGGYRAESEGSQPRDPPACRANPGLRRWPNRPVPGYSGGLRRCDAVPAASTAAMPPDPLRANAHLRTIGSESRLSAGGASGRRRDGSQSTCLSSSRATASSARPARCEGTPAAAGPR